jgi:CubicO group peptidase (beta-lactamase class C family)
MEIFLAIVENGAVTRTNGVVAPVPWWSFTKTVIAAGALALVRDGRLALDGPLPNRPYSLRQLLQHRAGVTNYGELAAYHEAVSHGDSPWPITELLQRTEADKLRFEPGHGWLYSNIGYLFVRQLIEAVCDERLDAALKRLVLGPLGIESARIATTPADLAHVVMGTASSYHPGWVYHGLMVGPLDEAAVLLSRLMTGTLLPADLLEQMRLPHPMGAWNGPGYGLGLLTGTAALETRVTGHTGKGPGSVIAVYQGFEKAPPVTVAAFSNGDNPAAVEHAAFAAIRG